MTVAEQRLELSISGEFTRTPGLGNEKRGSTLESNSSKSFCVRDIRPPWVPALS